MNFRELKDTELNQYLRDLKEEKARRKSEKTKDLEDYDYFNLNEKIYLCKYKLVYKSDETQNLLTNIIPLTKENVKKVNQKWLSKDTVLIQYKYKNVYFEYTYNLRYKGSSMYICGKTYKSNTKVSYSVNTMQQIEDNINSFKGDIAYYKKAIENLLNTIKDRKASIKRYQKCLSKLEDKKEV